MTQEEIEQLTPEQYSEFLAYGELEHGTDRAFIAEIPQKMSFSYLTDNDPHFPWISTLALTQLSGSTYGLLMTP